MYCYVPLSILKKEVCIQGLGYLIHKDVGFSQSWSQIILSGLNKIILQGALILMLKLCFSAMHVQQPFC